MTLTKKTLAACLILACLLALDKLGFIELRPNNRYRLKIDKTFRWRPDGPVMQFFRTHAVADYFPDAADRCGDRGAEQHRPEDTETARTDLARPNQGRQPPGSGEHREKQR